MSKKKTETLSVQAGHYWTVKPEYAHMFRCPTESHHPVVVISVSETTHKVEIETMHLCRYMVDPEVLGEHLSVGRYWVDWMEAVLNPFFVSAGGKSISM